MTPRLEPRFDRDQRLARVCIDAHRNEEDDQHVATAPAEPKQLRRKHVAKEHPEPPVPPVGTENAIPKRVPLERTAAVPSYEELHRVGVTDE